MLAWVACNDGMQGGEEYKPRGDVLPERSEMSCLLVAAEAVGADIESAPTETTIKLTV